LQFGCLGLISPKGCNLHPENGQYVGQAEPLSLRYCSNPNYPMTAQQSEMEIPKWELTLDYVETCNCDFGCPCNFNGLPTFGFCRAIVLYRIKEGFFGDTDLKGTDVAYVCSWPKAIHEGDGTLQIYVSKHANQKQRDALIRIMHGKAKGNGSFALFGSTMK
jgi:hypothetical protein